MNVFVQPGEKGLARALKRFKKMCERDGLFADIRKHRHYEKPSERRRWKMNAARRRDLRARRGKTRGGEPGRPRRFDVSTYGALTLS
jgi:small subunit ribosomal protein S21